jgi:hypothetical protein
LKRLVFAAIAANLATAAPLRAAIETVFQEDATLNAVWQAGTGQFERIAEEIGALLAHAEKYRCSECGFAARSFYWHCPACQSWDTFESYAHRQTALKIRYDFAMATSSIRKNLRISRGRARHEILAGDQGEPEGDAADRR